jgi:hypothetical protein
MARDRGSEKDDPGVEATANLSDDTGGRFPAFPELMRRALSLGFSGFFLTEEAVRKALGDTLPREWMDFAVEQSDRTRREFLERLSYELAQSLEKVDVAAVLRELLEGRTLEINAEIRLGEREAGSGDHKLHVAFRPGKEK